MLACIAPLLCLNRAGAQAPATAATPASAPAASAPASSAPASSAPASSAPAADAATPRGALKAFTLALDAGDRARILTLLQTNTDAEKKLAGATADLAEATATLRRAALKTFGAKLGRPLGVDRTATEDAIKRIDAAEETIDGDHAAVREPQTEGPPLTLVKKQSEWRVPVSELIKDVDPADIDRNLSDVATQTRLLRELAAEVEAGKYKTAVEARQVLDKRVMQSAMPQTGPGAATRAASRAATRP
jgi:hypothetical protein